MKIRRFIAVFLSAAVLCGILTVPAAALEDPDIRAKAALLVEAETGTVLYDKNCHDELSIASTTKIMSALLIFEAIQRGELRMDQSVTATASALRGLPEDGSTADIVEGETLTVEQLLVGYGTVRSQCGHGVLHVLPGGLVPAEEKQVVAVDVYQYLADLAALAHIIPVKGQQVEIREGLEALGLQFTHVLKYGGVHTLRHLGHILPQ